MTPDLPTNPPQQNIDLEVDTVGVIARTAAEALDYELGLDVSAWVPRNMESAEMYIWFLMMPRVCAGLPASEAFRVTSCGCV